MYRVFRNEAAAYLSLYFFSFSLPSFQTLNIFVPLFSETVRLIKLIMGGCIVYTTIRLLILICSLFLSLQCSKFKIFVTLFSGTVRPKKSKLGNLSTMGGCIVYTRIKLLPLICPFTSFFFLSNYQTLTILFTFFSRTVRPG